MKNIVAISTIDPETTVKTGYKKTVSSTTGTTKFVK